MSTALRFLRRTTLVAALAFAHACGGAQSPPAAERATSAQPLVQQQQVARSSGGASPQEEEEPGTPIEVQQVVGRWSGSWTSPDSVQGPLVGTADLRVDGSGQVTGTMHDRTQGMHGNVSGLVVSGGAFHGTAHYPVRNLRVSLDGALSMHRDGTLGGAMRVQLGAMFVGTVRFHLSRAPAALAQQ